MRRLARDYADAFDPVPLAPNAENWMKAIRDEFQFPLSFTMEGLKRDFHGWSEPTLVIVDPTSPLDLIDLWNMRQFHPQILPISVSWLHDASDLLRDFVKANYRPSRGNPHGVMTPTTIQFGRSLLQGGRGEAMARGKAILSEAGLADVPDAPYSIKLRYEPIWIADQEDFVHRPQRAEIEAATTDLELSISGEGSDKYCRFTALSPELTSGFSEYSEARWANVLKVRSYHRNDTLALALPSSFTAVAAGRLRLGESAVISRDGVVLLQKSKHHSEWFNLLTGDQAFGIWLNHAGVSSKRSEPGRITNRCLRPWAVFGALA